MGVLMMCFLHLYMKYDAPLFLQSIMPLKTVYDNSRSLSSFTPDPDTPDQIELDLDTRHGFSDH
jgi:hypothetical protein